MNGNDNLISALRNMVEDIEKLGAGPLTVDVTVLKQALSSLEIAQRTSALVDAQNLLLKSYESTMGRMDELLTKPPEGYVLVPVEPTEEMIEAICNEHGSGGWPQGYGRHAQHIRREHAGEGYRAALAARPEVSP